MLKYFVCIVVGFVMGAFSFHNSNATESRFVMNNQLIFLYNAEGKLVDAVKAIEPQTIEEILAIENYQD